MLFVAAVTVTVVVAVEALHPPVAAIVYVITVVPVDTVVTTPVFASIVATAGVALLHVPPGRCISKCCVRT
jgi:cytochrome c oxidase assembly factor CtaG